MSQLDFLSLLDRPVSASALSGGVGGARIVSEQHDKSKIVVDTSSLGWDAGEYGMTREQAIARAMETGGAVRLAEAANRRANLAMSADGRVSVFSAFEVPWHGLGTVIDQASTSQEALTFAGLADWAMQKVKMCVEVGGKWVDTGAYAVVRGDTGAVLTRGKAVGERYTIVTNEDCFDFLDAVCGPAGARYETAGAIGQGEKVWLLARMPDTAEVAPGDTLEQYIMFATSHDGTGSIKVYPTSVRTVCQNTYRASLRGRKSGITMRHTNNVGRNIEAAKRALGLAGKACDEFAGMARGLASERVAPGEARRLFKVLLDDICPAEVAGQPVTGEALDSGALARAIAGVASREERAAAEKSLERIERRRGEVFADLLTRYESDRCKGETAWSLVNAASEFADHSPLMRYKGTVQERRENRLLSILDGRAQEITDRAIELVRSN